MKTSSIASVAAAVLSGALFSTSVIAADLPSIVIKACTPLQPKRASLANFLHSRDPISSTRTVQNSLSEASHTNKMSVRTELHPAMALSRTLWRMKLAAPAMSPCCKSWAQMSSVFMLSMPPSTTVPA